MGEQYRKNKADRHKQAGLFVRLPPDLLASLHREADERDVSVAWIVRRLVSEGLTRLIPVADMLTTRDTRVEGRSQTTGRIEPNTSTDDASEASS